MEVEAERAEPGRTRVLSLATMSNATLCQPISQGVWKLLTVMKDDNITAAVRSDFCILQLAQSFFNKHGQNPTKFEYIRQKLREVGRLLLILQREFKIQTLEDAVKPANFYVLIQAVKWFPALMMKSTHTRLQALPSSWATHCKRSVTLYIAGL